MSKADDKLASPVLTERQIFILHWLDKNPSHKAGWLVKGRQPKPKEGPDKWDAIEICGDNGSIVVKAEDLAAIAQFKTNCPSPDKLYGITDEARALVLAALR